MSSLQSRPANPNISKPDYIYAGSPDGESARPWETVTPLAAWLGYRQGSPQFNTDFTIGGQEPKGYSERRSQRTRGIAGKLA